MKNLKEKHPDVKIWKFFCITSCVKQRFGKYSNDLAIGDFVAFSYSPVDSLNDIVKLLMKQRRFRKNF